MVSVKEQLLSRIRAEGPIPFDEFMDAALYGPGGFFAGEELRSVKAGDFLTSPEVSPFFGQMIGRFVEQERARWGEPFRVVEVGAGSGSLLRSLGVDIETWAVEVSPGAREALEKILPSGRVVEKLEEALGPGVVIANELLDNLPMAVAVRRGSGWSEQSVGEENGELVMVEHAARPEVASWADAFSGKVGEGGLVEVQLRAGQWLVDALQSLGRGAVVVIDYGGTAEELEHRRVAGTLRTYRSHHLGPDPLLEPGETDITADVNFSALLTMGSQVGAEVELHRQDDFLSDMGLREEVAVLRREELELARRDDEMARLKVRSRRIEAETLLNPRGLGDFRVLVARLSG